MPSAPPIETNISSHEGISVPEAVNRRRDSARSESWSSASIKGAFVTVTSAATNLNVEDVRSTHAAAYVRVRGERFLLEVEDGHVFLSHPRWSLAASGGTLGEAVEQLIEFAGGARESYLEHVGEEITADVEAYIAFLLRFT